MLIEAVDHHRIVAMERRHIAGVERLQRDIDRSRKVLQTVNPGGQHVHEGGAVRRQFQQLINVDSSRHGIGIPAEARFKTAGAAVAKGR